MSKLARRVSSQLLFYGYSFVNREELDSLPTYETIFCTVYYLGKSNYMLSQFSPIV